MKTIIITAYAVNPFKGSEDGTGWNITKELFQSNKVILITRKNNIPQIQKYLIQNYIQSSENLEYYGFDLPNWVLKIKKILGAKAHILYYYLWQYGVYRFIKNKGFSFDIAHCLNFHSDSHPHFLWKLKKPTVWGPIGHHPPVKKEFLKPYGFKAVFVDRFFYAGKTLLRFLDPFRRKALRKTDKLIAINSEVANYLKKWNNKVEIIPAVAAPNQIKKPKSNGRSFIVLSAGRFHYMKGYDITIKAFATFYHQQEEKDNLQLILIGAGPEESRLRKIAKEYKIDSAIEWIKWLPFSEMKNMYEYADVFLFPSHEGAGMVVPEAMSFGIPVLCFDNAGPGEILSNKAACVSYTNYNQAISDFASKLTQLKTDEKFKSELSEKAFERQRSHLSWEIKGETINGIYHQLMTRKTMAVFHPSSDLYGADRILSLALESMDEMIDIRVYLPNNGPLVDYLKDRVKGVEIIIVPDLPIIYRSLFSPIGILIFIHNYFQFKRKLREEIDLYKIQTVYLNTLACSFLLRMCKKYQLKTFIHVHEIIEHPKMIARITGYLAKKYADRVVCVSNAVLENLEKNAPQIRRKAIVIYNGIVSKYSSPKRKTAKIKFVLFGRLMPKKGQWFLIEALSLLPKEILEKCEFNLVGDVLKGNDKLKEELIQKINKKGLSTYVKLTGFVNDIDKILNTADVCLVPSLMKDPFPTTVLEAMSAGKPIIATNHGGAKEAIRDGISGCLIEPNNVVQFANTIQNLILNPKISEQLGKAAKEDFDKFFTLETFHYNWIKFQNSHQFI